MEVLSLPHWQHPGEAEWLSSWDAAEGRLCTVRPTQDAVIQFTDTSHNYRIPSVYFAGFRESFDRRPAPGERSLEGWLCGSFSNDLFIHFAGLTLLSTYSVPGTVPSSGAIMVKKTEALTSCSLRSNGGAGEWTHKYSTCLKIVSRKGREGQSLVKVLDKPSEHSEKR